MGKTLANFRVWWNAAAKTLGQAGSPVNRWGKLTDDDLLQMTGQPEQLAFDLGQGRSRASLKTDSDIRAWLVERGLFDKT